MKYDDKDTGMENIINKSMNKNGSVNNNDEYVNMVRTKMEKCAVKRGYTSTCVLKLSKELDKHIAKNLQEQLNSYRKKKSSK